jgi:ABC-type transporter Mla MlaB component
MTKAKDNNTGLLSKVVKFVRHPLTNWSDLDQPASPQDDGYSKQALKEMIERKRQNDFVRKHEFDHLRKLRQREPLGGPDRAGRPSFFQSSIPSNPDDRAMTLKKIDEIEAQMSKQWWKSKQDEVTVPGAIDLTLNKTGYKSGKPVPDPRRRKDDDNFETTQATGATPVPSSSLRAEYISTQMGQLKLMPEAGAASAASGSFDELPSSMQAATVGAGFSSVALSAAEFTVSVADPDLEEAAIGFANGDYAGVEGALFTALRRDKVDPELADVWMAALFGLYRATGQQDRFDAAAMDFAEKYGRSAPAWFSVPELLGRQSAGAALPRKAGPIKSAAVWSSPSHLDVAAIDELCSVLTKALPPWHLDWTALTSIEPDAVALLSRLFADWCVQPVQLRFSGAEELSKHLRFASPSGDASVDGKRWLLRMDALRIMGQHNEFEMVALDYCVTYEVSPPSWQDVRCKYLTESTPSGANDAKVLGLLDDPAPGVGEPPAPDLFSASGFHDSGSGELELAGELVGDAAQALAGFEEARGGATSMVINCHKLIRVDFSAAGSILNWAAAQQAAGCQVQFKEVHHLVAAFFNIIGIQEHASVVLGAS